MERLNNKTLGKTVNSAYNINIIEVQKIKSFLEARGFIVEDFLETDIMYIILEEVIFSLAVSKETGRMYTRSLEKEITDAKGKFTTNEYNEAIRDYWNF